MDAEELADEKEFLEHDLKNIPQQEICFKRLALDYNTAEKRFKYIYPRGFYQKTKEQFSRKCAFSIICCIHFLKSLFPILDWLPEYKPSFIIPDITSGFTVAILQLPQGMAYGILASLKPENGMYMAIFPVVVYFLLGTSRHASIGTFAIISLMVNSAVARVNLNNPVSVNSTLYNGMDDAYSTNLEIATSLTLTVGLVQLFMGITHLGALSVLLSDQLVSGFCMGSACHVATAVIPHIFGISIRPRTGMLKLVYMYMDIFSQIGESNVATIITSAVAILFLAVVKEQINDRFKDKLKVPIPIELIVVVLATAISYLVDLEGRYNVKKMGIIPTGLPTPVAPSLSLVPAVLSDAFAIAIIVSVISLSLAKIFAKKHHYNINVNQELVALGSANIFSSFFACFPCSAALARSSVQERCGGRTQVASLVSAGIMLLVMLFLAPLLYTLPKCILSAVILVALKSMFLQVKELKKAWQLSKIDAMIWLVTMVCTVLLDVTYGLLAGVAFSIVTVLLRTAFPSIAFLGNINGTEIYLDVDRFEEAKEIDGIKIFRFESPLYFVNKDAFKAALQETVPLMPKVCDEQHIMNNNVPRHIIIDSSSFSYVDMSGYEMLLEIMKEYKDIGITVFLAGCPISMWDIMRKKDPMSKLKNPSIFPTIHDAVQFCNVASLLSNS